MRCVYVSTGHYWRLSLSLSLWSIRVEEAASLQPVCPRSVWGSEPILPGDRQRPEDTTACVVLHSNISFYSLRDTLSLAPKIPKVCKVWKFLIHLCYSQKVGNLIKALLNHTVLMRQQSNKTAEIRMAGGYILCSITFCAKQGHYAGLYSPEPSSTAPPPQHSANPSKGTCNPWQPWHATW